MTTQPLTVSWSRLKDYEECPHKVLKRMQGHRSEVSNGRNFLHGTVADRVMRRLLEHDDPQPGMMEEWVDEILKEHAFNSDEYVIRWRGNPTEDYDKVRNLVLKVIRNLEPILFEKIIPMNYEAEVRFGFRGTPAPIIGVPGLDGLPRPVQLIGGIDILTQDPETGKYGLYDLKATENDDYVRGGILAQLTFYSIVIKTLFGEFPEEAAFITPACRERVVPVTITKEEVRTMLERIEKYCHGVWRKEWQPKDKIDSACMSMCDVRHACDLFTLPQGTKISFAEMAAQRRAARSKK